MKPRKNAESADRQGRAKVRKNIVLAMILVFWAGLLAAGEQQSLTVEECIRLGLERNPGLKSSQAAVDLALAKVREAYASALPSLKLSGGYTRLSEVDPFVITLPSGPGQPVQSKVISTPNILAVSFTKRAFSSVYNPGFQQTNWQVSNPKSLTFANPFIPSSNEVITPNFNLFVPIPSPLTRRLKPATTSP